MTQVRREDKDRNRDRDRDGDRDGDRDRDMMLMDMMPWPFGSVFLWLYGLARPRSSLALVPGLRSARVCADGDMPNCPKVVAHPSTPPAPLPGLNFCHIRQFWDFDVFFGHRPCPLVSLDPKSCGFVQFH